MELALRLHGSSLAAGLAAGGPEIPSGPHYNHDTRPVPGSGATPAMVPLFTVSCVTGAAIPLLHAFLAALQPARAAAGAPDRGQDPDPSGARPSVEEEQGKAQAAWPDTAAVPGTVPHWNPSPNPCYGALARALAAADFGERRAASFSPSPSSSGLGSASGDASPARSGSGGEDADGRACEGVPASGDTFPARNGGEGAGRRGREVSGASDIAEAPWAAATPSTGAPLAEWAGMVESSGLGLEAAFERTRGAGNPLPGQAAPIPGPDSGPPGAAAAEGRRPLRPHMGSGTQAACSQAGAPAHFQVDQSFEVAGVGSVVAGTVVAGAVRVGQRLLLGPTQRGAFAPVTVTCIQRAQARPVPWRRCCAGPGQACQSASGRVLGDFLPFALDR